MITLGSNTSYLYAWLDAENDMDNIGCKTPRGASKESYITSLKDETWWERYGWGKMKQYILAVGSEEVIRAAEWFALDYGIKAHPTRFYNKKNNAHMGDQSLLTLEMKKTIIDYIERRGNGLNIQSTDASNNALIMRIYDDIMSRKVYVIRMMDISEVDDMVRNQVREQLINWSQVYKIRQRLMEDPAKARSTMGPIVVVVNEDGTHTVIDGNTRLEAAKGAKGWKEVPVVFINWTEFGETEKVRLDNYTQFGLYANAEEFETKAENSDADLKRRINNIIVDGEYDLTQEVHVDRARDVVYSKMEIIVPSKRKIAGLFKSVINDFKRNQAEMKYQGNLISYNESFFKGYCWDNYGIQGIATVHVKVPEAAHAKAIGYILRVMRRTGATKGAIILYYSTKSEIYDELQDNWIEDLKNTIAYSKLPITVEVMPAFKT